MPKPYLGKRVRTCNNLLRSSEACQEAVGNPSAKDIWESVCVPAIFSLSSEGRQEVVGISNAEDIFGNACAYE